MDASSRAELAAYLASLGTPGLGHAALLQACTRVSRAGGPHAVALRALEAAFGRRVCDGDLPADLAGAARRAEQRLFGRVSLISLPADFPGAVPLAR
jgi:hypothetical protein